MRYVRRVDPGATVSLLLFGGFCGRTNECFNDVHILSVRRVSDGLAPSAAAAAGGAGAFQGELFVGKRERMSYSTLIDVFLC